MKRKKILLPAIAVVLIVNALFLAHIPMKPELWFISVIAILLFASPVIYMAIKWLGAKTGLALIIGLGLYALVFETIAIRTGWPYGSFQYGDLLGPKLFEATPATVLLAWSPLILGVLALTQKIGNIWKQIITGTVILMLIDVVLDPGAVHIGFWAWDEPGIYYGVPLINFFGWLVSGAIAIIAVTALKRYFKWPPVPSVLAYNLFFIVLFWAAVSAWAGQFIPALLGTAICMIIYGRLKASR